MINSSALRDQARLRAVSSEGAGAWLNVVPSKALNLVFEPREFTSFLRFWLGMPVFEAAQCVRVLGVVLRKISSATMH